MSILLKRDVKQQLTSTTIHGRRNFFYKCGHKTKLNEIGHPVLISDIFMFLLQISCY